MPHRQPHITAQLTCALLLAAAGFTPASVHAAGAYVVVPGSSNNSIHLAIECPPDWRVSADLAFLPAWVSHAILTSTPGANGTDVGVTFDVDQAASLGERGALMINLEARDSNGQLQTGASRRLQLQLGTTAPGIQSSFDIAECCIPSAGVEGARNGRPDHNLLLGAAPNPWRGLTSIRFGLRAASSVSLRVVDVAGRVVWEMHTPELAPGYHEVSWDGRDESGQRAAPGLYFYGLSAGGWRATGKTLHLR